MNFRKITAALLTLTLGLMLFACGTQDLTATTGTQPTDTLKGELVASGSTSVEPLFVALGEAFMVLHPQVKITVQGGGSSTGFSNVRDGVTEVGTLSRELKTDEKASAGLQEHILAVDGIAVIVNPANSVKDLSMKQIAGIFKGEVKDWREVGGTAGPITVVSREAGSGTRGAFEEILKVKDEVKATQEVNETGIVKNTVAGNSNAIGYISLGSLDATVHAVKVEGVAAQEATVADKSYKIARPFIAINKGDTSPIFKAFLDFVSSKDGQDLILKKGYFPNR